MSTETTNKKIKIDNGTTFGRTYTDKAIDAKLPTDLIASANKLSLGVGSTALGNGVNLDGFTYNEATKTLKAEGSGSALPAGTEAEPLKLNNIDLYNDGYKTIFKRDIDRKFIIDQTNSFKLIQYQYYLKNIELICRNERNTESTTLSIYGSNSRNVKYTIEHNKDETNMFIPACSLPESEGTYTLQYTYDNTNGSYYNWVKAEGGSSLPIYNHYIVIGDGTASNDIYLLIPSTNNIICNTLPELDTLLGTETRFIQASGVVTDNTSKLPIVAIKWQGSFSSSKIVTMSSEEATTKFTNIVDVVEPA